MALAISEKEELQNKQRALEEARARNIQIEQQDALSKKRPELCQYKKYESMKCLHGESCIYAHSPEELAMIRSIHDQMRSQPREQIEDVNDKQSKDMIEKLVCEHSIKALPCVTLNCQKAHNQEELDRMILVEKKRVQEEAQRKQKPHA